MINRASTNSKLYIYPLIYCILLCYLGPKLNNSEYILQSSVWCGYPSEACDVVRVRISLYQDATPNLIRNLELRGLGYEDTQLE